MEKKEFKSQINNYNLDFRYEFVINTEDITNTNDVSKDKVNKKLLTPLKEEIKSYFIDSDFIHNGFIIKDGSSISLNSISKIDLTTTDTFYQSPNNKWHDRRSDPVQILLNNDIKLDLILDITSIERTYKDFHKHLCDLESKKYIDYYAVNNVWKDYENIEKIIYNMFVTCIIDVFEELKK